MHVVDTVAISFVPVRQYDREDGLGKLGERERGFTTTLTLAVIASAPVDFLWKNVLHIQHAQESETSKLKVVKLFHLSGRPRSWTFYNIFITS